MKAKFVLCPLLVEGDMPAGRFPSGCWARIISFGLRPPLPEAFQAAAPARVAFHPPCGRPDRAGQRQNTGTVRRNGIIFKMLKKNKKSKISKFELS